MERRMRPSKFRMEFWPSSRVSPGRRSSGTLLGVTVNFGAFPSGGGRGGGGGTG